MKKLFTEIPYLPGERIVLRRIGEEDAEALADLTRSAAVCRYLPTFLFERKYDDAREAIRRLYTECFPESLILGIYWGDELCGLAEMYAYRDELHKVSIGSRLREKYWGMGIASEALRILVRYLTEETDIEIIAASTMAENSASANTLRKNGFTLVARGYEDWGLEQPVPTDKWIL